jgi:anti-anti-sigma factor
VRRLPAGITIVRATGDLSGHTSSQMYQLVADELARKPAQLVLDLSDATSVDDAAVEALTSAAALAGESDISFCLVGSDTGPVSRALAAADLVERFEIFATVCEAVHNR